VAAQLAGLSEPARAMLDHVLAAGGEATATGARHTVLPEDAATPAEELLSRRLLVPRGSGTLVVPELGTLTPAEQAAEPAAVKTS